MGQYYHPIILSKSGAIKGFWNAHKTGNGLKLMEHSYINNSLCNCVENYLIKNNGARVVWAGDYADPEKVRLSKAEANEIWKNKVASGEITCSFGAFWASKSPDLYKPESDDDENLYSLCDEKTIELPNGKEKVVRRAKKELEYDCSERDAICFYVNHDKKQIVELWETVVEVDGYRVHPLPLLTCEGNGRGGGDYYGSNMRYVGTWARDFIQPYSWREREVVVDLINKKGYTKIYPCFFERYALKSHIKGLNKLISVAIQDFGQGLDGTLDIKGDKEYLTEIHEAIKAIPDIPADYRNRPKPKAEPATSKA